MPFPEPPNFLIDLHCHTTHSDGNDTPAEFLENAAKRGMKVVAITDHDILPLETVEKNGQTFELRDYARQLGIHVIPGMEVSCDTFVDDVHIVALGCNWKDDTIAWIPMFAVQSKIKSYHELVNKLYTNGFNITWEELLLDGKRPPEAVQKKHLFELLAAKNYAKTWCDAKIMVRDNPNYDVKREKPDPVEVIRDIHLVGGIAILAHPYLIDENVPWQGKPITRDQYIRHLIDAGLDGIESCYTYDKTSYKGTQTKEEIRLEVETLYGPLVEIISGGSDYHADHKKGTQNARQIGDAGVPENISLNIVSSQ